MRRIKLTARLLIPLYAASMCLFLTVCRHQSHSFPESTRAVSLDDLAREEVARDLDYREATRFPAGDAVTVSLGEATGGEVVRLGLLDRGRAGVHVHARVFVDDLFVREVHGQGPAWADYTIELPASAQGACRIVFSSEEFFWASPVEMAPGESRSQPRNALIYLIDALRHDHMGVYGYRRDTTPHIDAFARDAVLYTRAIAQGSWTKPSVASLLTSTYPAVHGGRDRGDRLQPGLPHIGTALAEAGHESHAFMTNPSCLPFWGFDEGFSRLVDVEALAVRPDKDTLVVDAAIETLRGLAGRPWFFYVHTMAPHCPYEAPAPFGGRFQGAPPGRKGLDAEQQAIVNAYDGEVAYADNEFGRLLRVLKDLDQYDNTLIVLLSDHGEEFWEHGGMDHGHTLYDELVRVPLLVKYPGNEWAGQVCNGLCQLMDVAPTIVDALGQNVPEGFQGRSLLPRLRGTQHEETIAYSSLSLERTSMRAARTTTRKYIHDLAAGTRMWFDLVNDPGEQNPLVEEPEGWDDLRRHAEGVSFETAPGLHILVTGPLSSGHVVEGRVRGGDLGRPRLRYSARNGEVVREDGALRFRIELSPGEGLPPDFQAWSEAGAEQNHARIRVPVPPDADLAWDLALNGKPFPEEKVRIGAQGLRRTLAGTRIQAADILAPPDTYRPETLPERTAVYIWYTPDSEEVADSDLPPAMEEALGALGYLD